MQIMFLKDTGARYLLLYRRILIDQGENVDFAVAFKSILGEIRQHDEDQKWRLPTRNNVTSTIDIPKGKDTYGRLIPDLKSTIDTLQLPGETIPCL